MFRIVRHCSERLPGGARRWRALARAAGFSGTLTIRGYGVGGAIGAGQRALWRDRTGEAVLGQYDCGSRIDVWVRHAPDSRIGMVADPYIVFAHELGHYRITQRGARPRDEERAADAIGARLRKKVAR